MLLSISTTHTRATDLGYLLHKNPGRFQSYELSFGQAHVFYSEASTERCTACLLLDVDPIGLVRGKAGGSGLLSQYVNDRSYAASSFLSVAIAQVYGSALQGRCTDRPELASSGFRFRRRSTCFRFAAASVYLLTSSSRWAIRSRPHAIRLTKNSRNGAKGPHYSVTLVGDRAALGAACASLRSDSGFRQPQALFRRRR